MFNSIKKVVAVSSLIVGLVGVSAFAVSGMIQIKGSDTMVNLGQRWAEDFMKKYPNIPVSVTGGGSGTGFAALINGTCDIAEASRSIEPKEITLAQSRKIVPVEQKVGLDGLTVVVNPKNPVSKLTIDQLSDIFTGKIKNWSQVGGKPGTIVILSREVNSGTHVYFKEHVLRHGNAKGPEEYAPDALLLPSSQAIADEVASNPNAIGYYGMGYLSPKQKAILVAKDKSSAYINPTVDNVINGTYPISRPLFMYTNGKPQGNVKLFIDYVLSAEGQQIVSKLDFVPIKQGASKK
ncbi:MAG: phosphate ABC transporter substrate-binding protein [bacterium]